MRKIVNLNELLPGIFGPSTSCPALRVGWKLSFRSATRHRIPLPLPRVGLVADSNCDPVADSRVDRTTVWRKEGYHEDYTKSPVLPDDRDDITEYVELLAMIDIPGEIWMERRVALVVQGLFSRSLSIGVQ